MAASIKFGTDGWRGIIADDFTFVNVARCAQGLADYLRIQNTAGAGLVIGYDTRFASREFAETVAIGDGRERHYPSICARIRLRLR